MPLSTVFAGVNSQFSGVLSSGSGLLSGPQVASLTASQGQMSALESPLTAQLVSFYGYLGNHVETMNAAAKASGVPESSNPTQSLCQALSLAASGQFLNTVVSSLTALQAAITASNVGALPGLVSGVVTQANNAYTFTSFCAAFSTYVSAAVAGLQNLAMTVNAQNLPGLVGLSCLQHAPEFTTSVPTLRALEVQNMTRAEAIQLSLMDTGLPDATTSFTNDLQGWIGLVT